MLLIPTVFLSIKLWADASYVNAIFNIFRPHSDTASKIRQPERGQTESSFQVIGSSARGKEAVLPAFSL